MDVEAPRGLLRWFGELQDPRVRTEQSCICLVTYSYRRRKGYPAGTLNLPTLATLKLPSSISRVVSTG